jgi:hypothetical protein
MNRDEFFAERDRLTEKVSRCASPNGTGNSFYSFRNT